MTILERAVCRGAGNRDAPSAGSARATSGEGSEGGAAPLRRKYEDAATALARFEAKLENVEGRGIQETLPGVNVE
jgi:hypothetical protein